MIAAAIFLLILGYQFAFRQTIEAWRINKELHRQLQTGEELATQPGFTKRKAVNLEHALDLYKVDTAIFRSKLITTMSSLGEKHSLRMIEIPITVVDSMQYGQQHRIVLEGDYLNIVRFLHDVEMLNRHGQLRSAEIYLKKSVNLKKADLRLQLYFIGR